MCSCNQYFSVSFSIPLKKEWCVVRVTQAPPKCKNSIKVSWNGEKLGKPPSQLWDQSMGWACLLSPTGKPKSRVPCVLIDYLEPAFPRNYSLSIYCFECIFVWYYHRQSLNLNLFIFYTNFILYWVLFYKLLSVSPSRALSVAGSREHTHLWRMSLMLLVCALHLSCGANRPVKGIDTQEKDFCLCIWPWPCSNPSGLFRAGSPQWDTDSLIMVWLFPWQRFEKAPPSQLKSRY